MTYYVMTSSKGRCGCSSTSYYYTNEYKTKKAIKDSFKNRGYSGTVNVYREDEVSDSFKARCKYEL